jgi:hypothetical protein
MAAPSERTFFPLPIATGNARAISAPFQFVTTGEDHLRVTVVNSQSGVRVAIQGRRFDEAGALVPMAYSLAPTADRVASTRIFPLGVGAIVNLAVWAIDGAPAIGQMFVIVQLVRGREGGTELLGTLLQGYVTSTQTLGWPGSPIVSSIEGPGYVRQIQGTTPAIGTMPFEVVPTGARWELLSALSILTCDATVITRQPQLVVFGAYSALIMVSASQPCGALGVVNYGFTSGFGAPGTFAGVYNQNPLPVSIPLTAGFSILYNVLNIQPGDQMSAIAFCVREWLEVP